MPAGCTGHDDRLCSCEEPLYVRSMCPGRCAEVVAGAFQLGHVTAQTQRILTSYFHPTPAALVSISLSKAAVQQPVFAATNLINVGELHWRRYDPSTLLTRACEQGTICVPISLSTGTRRLSDVEDWKQEYPDLGILICCPFQTTIGESAAVGSITLGFHAKTVPADGTLDKLHRLAAALPNQLSNWMDRKQFGPVMGALSLPASLMPGPLPSRDSLPDCGSWKPQEKTIFLGLTPEEDLAMDSQPAPLTKRSGSEPSLVSLSARPGRGLRSGASSPVDNETTPGWAQQLKAHSLSGESTEHFCIWRGGRYGGVPPSPFGEVNQPASLRVPQHKLLQTFEDPALEKKFCAWHTRNKMDSAVALLLFALHIATMFPHDWRPRQGLLSASKLIPLLHTLAPPLVARIWPVCYEKRRDAIIMLTSALATVTTAWMTGPYHLITTEGHLAYAAIPQLACQALLVDFTFAYGVRFRSAIFIQLVYMAVAFNRALEVCYGSYTAIRLTGFGFTCTTQLFFFHWVSGGMLSAVLIYVVEAHFRRRFVISLQRT